jgi:23S rRNA (uridine2552-2'-O)-methyltransferase
VTRSRRPQDHWGRRAKREGYAARSVYKLEEIDRKVRLFKPGMNVLDLGAFPGSWTAYAATVVGPRGRVLGLDLQEHRGALPPNAEIRKQDVMADLDALLAGTEWNAVVSDMAPSTTGNRFVDQSRSFQLVTRALDIAEKVLVPGGHSCPAGTSSRRSSRGPTSRQRARGWPRSSRR